MRCTSTPPSTGVLTRSLVAPHRGVAALTTREREVLVLVAQGLSNRDIGRALSIGERTVQTHLGNVLAKLELTLEDAGRAVGGPGGPAGSVRADLEVEARGIVGACTSPPTSPPTTPPSELLAHHERGRPGDGDR